VIVRGGFFRILSMRKNKLIDKKAYKRGCGKCAICGLDIYEALDVHRWKVEGKDDGKYRKGNAVVLCANHHRLVHAEKIKIEGVFTSTIGEVIIYHDEDGKEQIKSIR